MATASAPWSPQAAPSLLPLLDGDDDWGAGAAAAPSAAAAAAEESDAASLADLAAGGAAGPPAGAGSFFFSAASAASTAAARSALEPAGGLLAEVVAVAEDEAGLGPGGVVAALGLAAAIATTVPAKRPAAKKWTAEETALLEAGIALYTTRKPSKIAAHIGTRTASQVRDKIRDKQHV